MGSYTMFEVAVPAAVVEPLERLRRLQAEAAERGTDAAALAAAHGVPPDVAERQVAAVRDDDDRGGDWEAKPVADGAASVRYEEDFAWNPFNAALSDALGLADSDAEVVYAWADAGWDEVVNSGTVRVNRGGVFGQDAEDAGVEPSGLTMRERMLTGIADKHGSAVAVLAAERFAAEDGPSAINDLVAGAAVLRRLREGSANLGLPDVEAFVARVVGGDPEGDAAARSIRASMASNMAKDAPADIPSDIFPALAGDLLEIAGKLRAVEERLLPKN